jgi:tRNA (guanine-N7-)-methyltransferase
MQSQPIRSYVRRQGRITRSQKNSLSQPSPFLLNPDDLLTKFFKQTVSTHICEVGFGMGKSLIQNALNYPDIHFLGLEVYLPGIASVIKEIISLNLQNLWICQADAVYVLKEKIPPKSLNQIHFFFPDPWPKKRHWKRRLLTQTPFINTLKYSLKPSGVVHIATDWQPYAEAIQEHWLNFSEWSKANPQHNNTFRPQTKYEQRGEKLGLQACDLLYQLQLENEITT